LYDQECAGAGTGDGDGDKASSSLEKACYYYYPEKLWKSPDPPGPFPPRLLLERDGEWMMGMTSPRYTSGRE